MQLLDFFWRTFLMRLQKVQGLGASLGRLNVGVVSLEIRLHLREIATFHGFGEGAFGILEPLELNGGNTQVPGRYRR